MFRVLTHVMSLPDIGNLLPGARVGDAAKSKTLGTAVVRLHQSLHADFDPEDVARWLTSWGLAYTLFAMGQTRNWGLADV